MMCRGEVIPIADRGEAAAALHQPVNAPEAAVHRELRHARLGKVRPGGVLPRRTASAHTHRRAAGYPMPEPDGA